MTDHQLLAEYAEKGSAEAFSEIVRRHADGVYSACLRVLGEPNAAEDATQAAFMSLARQRRALKRIKVLPAWLFTVATRAALNLRESERRRERHERKAAEMRERSDAGESRTWEALRPRLDAELYALPAAQRDVVILRYLWGQSEAETATELGWGRSRVSVTLSRALAGLRRRLGRRGVTVPAAILAGLLAERATVTAPAALVGSIQAVCVGGGAASPASIAITEGITRSLFLAKVKTCAAVLAVVAVVGGGAALAVRHLAGPRNFKLRNIPENTWVKICALEMDQGAGEVRWCYDSDRRRFVRVGGSSNFTNEVWSFDLGAESWTCNLPFTKEGWGNQRPGHGCNKGICYDPDGKCVWVYGGTSSYAPPGTVWGLWKGSGDLGVGDWEHVPGVPSAQQASVAYDPVNRKVILRGHDLAALWRTIIFDPVTGKWHRAPASPHEPGQKGKLQLSTYPGFLYVPELKGCLLVAGAPKPLLEKYPQHAMVTWLFDATKEDWRDLKPGGNPPWRRRQSISYDSRNGVVLLHGGVDSKDKPINDTWVYLIEENRWVEMKPQVSPYPEDGTMLLAYDPEHNVHVLAKPRGWRKPTVWVYRYKK